MIYVDKIMRNYLKYIKEILFILILISLCKSFFGSEKSNFGVIENEFSYKFKNNIYITNDLNFNYKYNFNDLKKNYSYTGFQSNLYRSGLYMLGFGAACGIIGGVLFGLSYLIEWYLANSIGWAYENVIFNIFILDSVYGIQSYYTTIAIAFWISGIVLMALSVIIIPGIILMVIDSISSVKRISPLKEAVGFAIKF